MRVVVTGREGQVATALAALATGDAEIVRLGRPEIDLERPEALAAALRAERPDVVISAAAYTAVDRAESEPERARTVNAVAPGGARRSGPGAGRAHPSTCPPTTCSTA